MTMKQRIRRRLRRAGRGRRTPVRAERRTQQARAPRAGGTVGRRFVQTTVCGLLFASLVLLKLIVPGNLAAFRGTLAQWLVRDADFAAAFAAVGQAAAAPERLADSLGEAYTAVFGAREAIEVSGSAAESAELPPLPLPDYASAEAPELPFGFSTPLAGTLTSSFGWRDDPNGAGARFHTGVDLAAEAGTPFASFADGTVGVVGESTVLGRYLTVRHAGGIETLYAHCDTLSAVSGAAVARGETLGTVGATGNATGAHLHFELLQAGKYLDPLAYLSDVGEG